MNHPDIAGAITGAITGLLRYLSREQVRPPSHMSVSRLAMCDWDDAQSRAQWEGSDGFRERIGPVRELCDDVQAGNFQLSASFPST